MAACALCESDVVRQVVCEEGRGFCCPGCLAVYQILSVQGALAGFAEHPLFREAVKSGLIANPALLEQIRQREAETFSETKKLYFEVEDLWCPSCALVIQLVLRQRKGVVQAVVDYATDLGIVEYDPRSLSKEYIFLAIRSLGYHPLDSAGEGERRVSFSLLFRFLIAGFFTFNIMMFSYPLYASYFTADLHGEGSIIAWLCGAASLPILLYSAWPIWRRCWTSLWVGVYGMEALVTIGVFSAWSLSVWNLWHGNPHVYFDSMSMIITLVLLGKIIETKAKFSAKDALFRLNRSVPKKGRKKERSGLEHFVFVKEIAIGDQIVVFPGEKVVLDGVVKEGRGACDESLITGEATPVPKEVGSSVLGGALVQQGRLVVEVTVSQEASTLQKMIAIVEEGLEQKTVELRPVDAIIRWFTPLVILLAAILSFSGESLRAMSVLLIACPCAIGIAAPLAESLLFHRLIQLGALVRNRSCLRFLGRETLFAFDKTGTITQGKFRVVSGVEHLSQNELSLLKGIALQSNHPIACAIANSIDIPAAAVSHTEEFAGRGLIANQGENVLILGSRKHLQEQGIAVTDHETNTHFAINDQHVAALHLADEVRPSARQMIATLAPTHTLLLSGDANDTVAKIAQICGFTQWLAEQHPLQKREVLESFREKGHIIAMLGDGINDAPALTQAHIGISVVNATDMSIQVSDILLTTDDLVVIPKLRKAARFGRKIIHQNLFWAFFYNVIGIGFATLGFLTPLFATVAMVISSLLVVFNSLRLKLLR